MASLGRTLTQLRKEHSKAQREVERLEEAIAAIQKLVGAKRGTYAGRGRRPRRRLSAAARRRISLAQKARWAKVRSQKAA
jgi:hypothetical protein